MGGIGGGFNPLGTVRDWLADPKQSGGGPLRDVGKEVVGPIGAGWRRAVRIGCRVGRRGALGERHIADHHDCHSDGGRKQEQSEAAARFVEEFSRQLEATRRAVQGLSADRQMAEFQKSLNMDRTLVARFMAEYEAQRRVMNELLAREVGRGLAIPPPSVEKDTEQPPPPQSPPAE